MVPLVRAAATALVASKRASANGEERHTRLELKREGGSADNAEAIATNDSRCADATYDEEPRRILIHGVEAIHPDEEKHHALLRQRRMRRRYRLGLGSELPLISPASVRSWPRATIRRATSNAR